MTLIHDQYFLICYCHGLAAQLCTLDSPFEALFSSLVRRWRCSEAPGIPSFWNPLYFTPYTGLSLSASPVIFLRVQLEYMYVFMNNCTFMVLSFCWTQKLSFKHSYTLCVSMPTDVFVSYHLIHQRLVFKQTLTLELQSSETHSSECPSFSQNSSWTLLASSTTPTLNDFF